MVLTTCQCTGIGDCGFNSILANISRDPNTTNFKCCGRSCDINNTCKVCYMWDENQWHKFQKSERKSDFRLLKKREHKLTKVAESFSVIFSSQSSCITFSFKYQFSFSYCFSASGSSEGQPGENELELRVGLTGDRVVETVVGTVTPELESV